MKRDATRLDSSYLINSGNTSITAGRDIGVIASEVTSGGELNLNAVEDVLIAAGDVLKQTQQWDEKMSFLSGGNLFEMEKKRQEITRTGTTNDTEMALAINGRDGMASSNGHVGNDSKPVLANNREFAAVDKTKGDALPVVVVPIVISSVLAVGAALSDPKK